MPSMSKRDAGALLRLVQVDMLVEAECGFRPIHPSFANHTMLPYLIHGMPEEMIVHDKKAVGTMLFHVVQCLRHHGI